MFLALSKPLSKPFLNLIPLSNSVQLRIQIINEEEKRKKFKKNLISEQAEER